MVIHTNSTPLGAPLVRVEDARLLTGAGCFGADLSLPGQLHADFVRSPYPHANIRGIETSGALALPGVVGIWTAADLEADGVGCVPGYAGLPAAFAALIKGRGGMAPAEAPWEILARGRVRHVGQEIALVIADTPATARQGTELVEVDYEELPPVVNVQEAVAVGTTRVWEHVPGNIAFDWEFGDSGAVAQAFARATHVTRLTLTQNRVAQGYLEPRAAVAEYGADDEVLTLHAGSQGAHRLQRMLADFVLNCPREKVRVISRDVGGGFGGKLFLYNEYAALCWAARKLGHPVKWVGDRSDAFLTDIQARDHHTTAELALDAQGHFLALRVKTLANMGAFMTPAAAAVPTFNYLRSLQGVYQLPTLTCEVRCVLTNTAATNAYRGAGRPEGAYAMERLVDCAARELGIDPATLRARNMIPAEAMPYRTAAGLVYDSGEFENNMREALVLAHWDDFAARRDEARARGKLRGIGIGNFVEVTGGLPNEYAEACLCPDGSVDILTGSTGTGQGVETAYAQLAASCLDLPMERVRVIGGDTGQVAQGEGCYASRSMRIAGCAIQGACAALTAQARDALGLDASEAVDWAALARKRVEEGRQLRAPFEYVAPAPAYPNGCQVCEVEIDEETGSVEVVSHVAVDDVGVAINPLLVHGQIAGGIAQGLGQALYEEVRYDATGQMLNASFMDYAMPRADQLPAFNLALNEVPCRTNPLGVKGAGEGGTIGALGAVMNAVVDALAPYGVRHIDMPAHPEKILAAMGRL